MAVIGNAKPADLQMVHAILAVMADPVARKAEYEELCKHSALSDQAKAHMQSGNNAHTEARRIAEEHAAASEARDKALADKERRLAELQDGLGKREAAFKKDSAERERDLMAREQRVSSAERTIKERDEKSQRTAERIAAEELAWMERARKLHETATGKVA